VAQDAPAARLVSQAREHLDKLPKRLQPRVKAALHEVIYAESREEARETVARMAAEYGAKYPKAVTTLEKDADVLLTFFDFPAENWKHLRTSNVIESAFATVRLRQRVTKGAGSRTAGILMADKLLDMAQGQWRRLDGARLPRLVRAGSVFVNGVQQEEKASTTGEERLRHGAAHWMFQFLPAVRIHRQEPLRVRLVKDRDTQTESFSRVCRLALASLSRCRMKQLELRLPVSERSQPIRNEAARSATSQP
jgi:hypothetical protein